MSTRIGFFIFVGAIVGAIVGNAALNAAGLGAIVGFFGGIGLALILDKRDAAKSNTED